MAVAKQIYRHPRVADQWSIVIVLRYGATAFWACVLSIKDYINIVAETAQAVSRDHAPSPTHGVACAGVKAGAWPTLVAGLAARASAAPGRCPDVLR
jgi:hypothetical protein